MAEWKYTLKHGKALRHAIRSDNMGRVLELLKDCYDEIHRKFPEEYDEDDLQDDLDEIENEEDNLENYEEYGMEYEDVEDNVNYILNNFYDLCDALRVWAEI